MNGHAQRRPLEPGRPLSIRVIVVGGVLVGTVGMVAAVALFYFYGGGTDQDRAGLDVVRTAAALMAGTGGAVALLLAARRQRSTELTLEHQREVAVEQRITELYTRAVDQLGNDQAPVRLGGLHALERLAQNNPDQRQRQTIVDVICAYLRMPYALPDENPPSEDAPEEAHTRYERRRQELQVRLTAQRILTAHLRPKAGDNFWPNIDLDLTEAQLHRIDLSNCHIRNALFFGARFSGNARFSRAQFSGDARFSRAQFSGTAGFAGARFSGTAWFGEAQFSGPAEFGEAQFSGPAEFGEAQFSGPAGFYGAQFSGDAGFGGAQFSGTAWFGEAQFSFIAEFSGARALPAENVTRRWPAAWTTREAREGEEAGWLYLVRVEEE